MKGFHAAVCLLLIGICAFSAHYAWDTERRARIWQDKVESAEVIQNWNKRYYYVARQSEKIVQTVQTLAEQNKAFCVREAEMLRVVNEYEQENMRLKKSLKESVRRMQDLQEELDNQYIRIQALQNKLNYLEKLLDKQGEDVDMKTMYDIIKVVNQAYSLLEVL